MAMSATQREAIMKRVALALMVCIAPLPAFADHDDDPGEAPVVIDRGDVSEQLSDIESIISEAISRARGKAAVQPLRRAREKLKAVRDQVNGSPNPREWRRAQRDPNRWFGEQAPPPSGDPGHGPPPPPVERGHPPGPPAPPRQPSPMADAELSQLAMSIDQQPTTRGRLGVLHLAAEASHFLVWQVQVLLARFGPGPDRAEAMRLLQPRVLDRENEYQLAGLLQQAPPPPQVPPPQPPNPYAGLVQRASFAAKTSVKLMPGLYKGTFTVAGMDVTVEGSGRDQTIIDGDLVIQSAFNKVRGLTVLGKVVILGNQNQVSDVDYRGGIQDKGLMNKY
jgi:hypothetical protein